MSILLVSEQLHQTATEGPVPHRLQAEAAKTLFGNPEVRPEPASVAALIGNGLTEAVIFAAAKAKGLAIPKMATPLEDLATSLPYYQQISDALAAAHPSDALLFAGRDAEVLYDDFCIAHPDKSGQLLPASSNLWWSRGIENRALATRFLGQYGLTGTALAKKENRYVLVDSGFRGSIGSYVDEQVAMLHGVSILSSGRLLIRLVSARPKPDGLGEQILDLPGEERLELHRYNQVHGQGSDYPSWASGNTYGLAVTMQLMPRYHGAYEDLKLQDDKVIAVPSTRDSTWPDLDQRAGWINESVVNRVAAAVIQYRIVRAAMERVGSAAEASG